MKKKKIKLLYLNLNRSREWYYKIVLFFVSISVGKGSSHNYTFIKEKLFAVLLCEMDFKNVVYNAARDGKLRRLKVLSVN